MQRHYLSNTNPTGTDVTIPNIGIAQPCQDRLTAIAAKIATGQLPTPEEIAFAQDVQANPGNYKYSDSGCVQHSASPISSGFELNTTTILWGILILVAANEIGVFGKNKFQMIGPLI